MAQLAKRLFTVEEFHRMGRAGVFSEDDRVELLDGEIVQMTPIGSRHAACVKRLIRLFDRAVGDRAIVAAQDPLQLGAHSEPQPDLMLLKPRSDFYGETHPTATDVFLLVEVADTSADTDREAKIPLYARFGVPEVWLVDVAADTIEVFRRPTSHGYDESRLLHRGEYLNPQTFPDLVFAVEAVLG